MAPPGGLTFLLLAISFKWRIASTSSTCQNLVPTDQALTVQTVESGEAAVLICKAIKTPFLNNTYDRAILSFCLNGTWSNSNAYCELPSSGVPTTDTSVSGSGSTNTWNSTVLCATDPVVPQFAEMVTEIKDDDNIMVAKVYKCSGNRTWFSKQSHQLTQCVYQQWTYIADFCDDGNIYFTNIPDRD
ncbi:uncharacterized protein [Procambarus clarkii]|uniref:uncharacterized protein n=1 Tax=Procambarus clarkii TaxID=6728 RepID=UPI001E676AF2|nr:uncharacterized protein LOC123767464 [Procambarus clarkii]